MAHLVDSSVFIALFLDFDTNHHKAVSLMEGLHGPVYIPYGAVGETATVLAYKHSKKQADLFIEYLEQSDQIEFIDARPRDEITFFTSLSQCISFVDSTLLFYSRKMDIPLITFDRQLAKIARGMKRL